ncbi:precorrin-3B synthase [Brucella sp. IR073]|uniref:precorrin-3B synthase n=1 Tax=unclassified Brucella TaxID=2632610 RepID=UPI003B97EB7E
MLNACAISGGRVDRRSACPGLFRMTEAADGRICRVKLSCGRLSTSQARAVADVAERHGNGIIELTSRANLQLRGIGPDNADDVIVALMEAGLGPLVPEGDDIRNVMVNPTAGIDTNLAFDTLPLAGSLLETLQTTPAYYALSPKFSILIDGGEACAHTEHTSDIWIAATEDGERFVFGLASCPPVAPSFPLAGIEERSAVGQGKANDLAFPATNVAEQTDGGGDACTSVFSKSANVTTPIRPLTRAPSPQGGRRESALGTVHLENARALVTGLLDLFLELSATRPGVTRMKHLLAEMPASDVLERLKTRLAFSIAPADNWHRAAPRPFAHLGVHPQWQEGLAYAGAAAPLGRLTPERLRAIADIAAEANGGQIRLTPWQGVLLPDITENQAPSVLERLSATGLIDEPGHPLADIITCSGSTGCVSALADTQTDAAKLAGLLDEAAPVHLTGCPKSCAAIRPAPATLVAVGQGRYDLFLRQPAGPSRFGRLLAANITIEEAALLLKA